MKVKHLIASVAMLCSTASFATCTESLQFARDKQLHVAGSAVLASAATLATDDPVKGFAAAMSVGIAKEAYDKYSGKGCASYADVAYDALGAAAGAYLTYKLKNWYVQPSRNGVKIGYVVGF